MAVVASPPTDGQSENCTVINEARRGSRRRGELAATSSPAAASLSHIRCCGWFTGSPPTVLNPVQAQAFGEHNGLQVLVFLLLLKPLLLQERHQVVALLHHLQHLVQDLLLLGQLLLALQVI